MAGAFLLATTPPAAAQCRSTANSADQSTPGSVRFQAATTQQDCGGARTVHVRAYIEGLSSTCYTGEQTESGYRINESSSDNAGVLLGNLGWGTWNGYSTHWFIQNGQFTSIQERRRTVLYAYYPQPDPQEECEAMGWEWSGGACNPPPNCPIIIATGQASVYRLTSSEEGVDFDINGDGVVERVAWTEAGAEIAFLAMDRNGDGQITSGRELFGNHTIQGSNNGFDALLRTAAEANSGVLTGSAAVDHPLFGRLLLWTDLDHDGISQPAELRPLGDVFAEIGFGYQLHNRQDGHGNRYAFRGWALYRTKPGRNKAATPKEGEQRRRAIYDVILATVR